MRITVKRINHQSFQLIDGHERIISLDNLHDEDYMVDCEIFPGIEIRVLRSQIVTKLGV